MNNDNLKCSVEECKQRMKQVDTMSFKELTEYTNKCALCGNWVLKDNKVAQETYQKISLKWAETFNKNLFKN